MRRLTITTQESGARLREPGKTLPVGGNTAATVYPKYLVELTEMQHKR